MSTSVKLRSALGAVAALVALAPAGPAHADPMLRASAPNEPAPFTLSAIIDNNWPRDAGYRVFRSESAVVAGGLAASYDLDLAPRLVLAPYAEWQRESTEGSWQQSGDTRLEVDTVSAGLVARVPLRFWLQPFVRVGGGVSWADARLLLSTDGKALAGDSRAPFLRAGGGLMVRSKATRVAGPKLPPFAVSLSLEGGYVASSQFDFTLSQPKVDNGEGEPPIALGAVPLGKLGRSRPYSRVTLSLHW